MNTKRLVCLLIAVLMLVTLFSACAQNDTKQPSDDKGNTSDTADQGNTADTGDDGNDNPAETEKRSI